MTKTELINDIVARMELPRMTVPPSKKTIDAILIALADAATERLRAGGDVVLPGMGTLRTQERPARMGRNPQTGQSLEIGPTVIIKFKAVPRMKRRVRGGRL
jgi:DNA-binding protein HU-beta